MLIPGDKVGLSSAAEDTKFKSDLTRFPISAPNGNGIGSVNLDAFIKSPDIYTVLLFYPKDFTYVCPTELEGFNELDSEFANVKAKVFGISTDTAEVHEAWRKHDSRIKNLKYSLISDATGDLSRYFGVFDGELGVSQRGLFIINNDTVVFSMCTHMDNGRDPQTILTAIQAHSTGQRTPCRWSPGKGFV